MASIRPVPPHDRPARLGLVALTVAGLVMLLWLVATLAASAFG